MKQNLRFPRLNALLDNALSLPSNYVILTYKQRFRKNFQDLYLLAIILKNPYTVIMQGTVFKIIDIFREAAGNILMPAWHDIQAKGSIEADHKALQNLSDPGYASEVTAFDKLCEIKLKEEFARLMPGVSLLGEESTHGNWRKSPLILNQDNKTLTIDPIDGTTSFRKGGAFGLMAAFRVDAVTEFSVIHYPVQNDTLYAIAGKGTWKVGENADGSLGKPERLHVAPVDRNDMKMVCHRPELIDKFRSSGRFSDVTDEYFFAAQGIREGILNNKPTSVHMYRDPMPWDALPTMLIMREAGGDTFTHNGQNVRNVTAGMGHLVLSPGPVATNAVFASLGLHAEF